MFVLFSKASYILRLLSHKYYFEYFNTYRKLLDSSRKYNAVTVKIILDVAIMQQILKEKKCSLFTENANIMIIIIEKNHIKTKQTS